MLNGFYIYFFLPSFSHFFIFFFFLAGVLTAVSTFSSETCPRGLVATEISAESGGTNGSLRIFRVEEDNCGQIFNQHAVR